MHERPSDDRSFSIENAEGAVAEVILPTSASATASDSPGLLPRLRLIDIAILIGVNLMWGMNLIAMKIVIGATAPLSAGALRMMIVAAICLPRLRFASQNMGYLLAFAIITGALHLIAVNLSLSMAVNIGALAIVTLLGVPFALLLAVALLGERISLGGICGVALSLAGCSLLLFDPEVIHEGWALAVIALATFIWAGAMIIQRRLVGIPVLTIYAWTGLIGTAVLLPLALFHEGDAILGIAGPDLEPAAWLLFAGIGPMLLGQGGATWLLQRHAISTIMPLMLFAPVVTVLASSIMFGTPITGLTIAGGLVTLLGTGMLTLRGARGQTEKG